jgi:hypothetical protein
MERKLVLQAHKGKIQKLRDNPKMEKKNIVPLVGIKKSTYIIYMV